MRERRRRRVRYGGGRALSRGVLRHYQHREVAPPPTRALAVTEALHPSRVKLSASRGALIMRRRRTLVLAPLRPSTRRPAVALALLAARAHPHLTGAASAREQSPGLLGHGECAETK